MQHIMYVSGKSGAKSIKIRKCDRYEVMKVCRFLTEELVFLLYQKFPYF